MYLNEKKEDLTTYTAIRKLHEVNNYKGEHQLLSSYRRAGWMSPRVSDNIKMVVQNCKICQKFTKSVNRPKVTLQKVTIFHEIVTLDLKVFRSKHVLWIIDSFSRFVQGKVILNKRAETIISSVMDTWILCFGIPTVGF